MAQRSWRLVALGKRLIRHVQRTALRGQVRGCVLAGQEVLSLGVQDWLEEVAGRWLPHRRCHTTRHRTQIEERNFLLDRTQHHGVGWSGGINLRLRGLFSIHERAAFFDEPFYLLSCLKIITYSVSLLRILVLQRESAYFYIGRRWWLLWRF